MARLLRYLCLLFGPLILAAALLRLSWRARSKSIRRQARLRKTIRLLAQSKRIRGECTMPDSEPARSNSRAAVTGAFFIKFRCA